MSFLQQVPCSPSKPLAFLKHGFHGYQSLKRLSIYNIIHVTCRTCHARARAAGKSVCAGARQAAFDVYTVNGKNDE